ncbi:MAG: nucleoside hydrolase [Planctomycetaceae bacterium]|nr:nucleoside hydrolase [Planctomycetaceae bacterium]
MSKKIILDVDPGFVDAIVLCVALFDPEVEVLAVTSVGGNIAPQLSARNVQAMLEFLDPPRLPRFGIGTEPDEGLPVDGRHVHGIDGLCGTALPVAELRSQHPAEKVICDTIRAHPGQVSLICLGPLTNIARAFKRDAEIPLLIDRLYIQGGAVDGLGNITPAAEFNVFCDPKAAKFVFQTLCHKTLIPLDVTNPIYFHLGMMEQLPPEGTKLGAFLRCILLPGFRAYRQCYGLEGVHIHDLLAYVCAINPAWCTIEEMACEVETEGTVSRGATVFDRRQFQQWKNNIEVVTKLDQEAALDYIFNALNHASELVE